MEWLPKLPLTQPIYAVSNNENAAAMVFGWKKLLGSQLVRRPGPRKIETVRMQDVGVMEHNRVEVAIIDHLATGGATVEMALLLRRQIFEPLLFHSG